MNQPQLAASSPQSANLQLLIGKSLRRAFNRTPLRYPTAISLQKRKCPQCKESLATPALAGGTVRAACGTQGCGFSVDLFWVPA